MTHIGETAKRIVRFRKNYEGTDGWPGIDTGPGLTKQAFSEECDINNIMKRFEETGQLPEMIKENPQYGDFADVGTYQEACNVVLRAQEQFSALSAQVRSKFANDPARFLEFATNPENQAELVKMGLATERVGNTQKAELVKMGLATERVGNTQPVPSAVTPSPASSGPKDGGPSGG